MRTPIKMGFADNDESIILFPMDVTAIHASVELLKNQCFPDLIRQLLGKIPIDVEVSYAKARRQKWLPEIVLNVGPFTSSSVLGGNAQKNQSV